MRVERGERILMTTLTKRMAEDLTTYLAERGVRVEYLHSDATPTLSLRLPTTTNALKRKRRPPFTTRLTRSMLISDDPQGERSAPHVGS